MKRFNLFFILLSAIFIVISGCNHDEDGDTYISEGDIHITPKTLPRNVQASFGNGIEYDITFSHVISPNNYFVAFITTQGNENDVNQLYTVTARPVKDKPTNYLIGCDGFPRNNPNSRHTKTKRTTQAIGRDVSDAVPLFRISPNSKYVVWIDDDYNPVTDVADWSLKCIKVNPKTGAPVGTKIILKAATYENNTWNWVEDFRISPDSKWVAYRYGTETGGGKDVFYELYRISIDGLINDEVDNGVRVHPAMVDGDKVIEDYNFTANSDWLIFRSYNANLYSFGLYSSRIEKNQVTPANWLDIELAAPPTNGDPGVQRFKTTPNSKWVAFTSIITGANGMHKNLYSCHTDPDDEASDDPVQLHPDFANTANTNVQDDFEIASGNRVVFRANLTTDIYNNIGEDFDQYGLYSAEIDHTVLSWVDLLIQAAGTTTGVGVNIPYNQIGNYDCPIGLVAFRLTPDLDHVVFLFNRNNGSSEPVIFDIFSHSVKPNDDAPVQLTPSMPDTTNGPAGQNWGVRDFQVSSHHDYVVLVGSLSDVATNGCTIYELYRAKVGRAPTDADEDTPDEYRIKYLLHQPFIPGSLVYVFHLLKDTVYFSSNLSDPLGDIFNGYYVDIDKLPGIEHQISDMDEQSPSTLPFVDAQPRTLEKYTFAPYNYWQFIFDCYPPSGDGDRIFMTYSGRHEGSGSGSANPTFTVTSTSGSRGLDESFLYIGFGPRGKKASLMNEWSIKIIALLTLMGIAILVFRRKSCMA